jgi:UDP-3-O-[3-hydroxymyristoyl] glucosamine N-acyltransferase
VNSSVKGNESLIGSPAQEPKSFFRSAVIFKKLPDMYRDLEALKKKVDELTR